MTSARPAPELLAPAGDWDALRAACANGADAVYFGLSRFSARARAANFDPAELPDVMQFLHARGVRGFVALNTLIFADELADAAELIAACAAAAVDALIVQDLGLVRLSRAITPALPVHGSTQMTIADARGVEVAARLGVERVVLARELTLADIRRVTAETDVPVEVFVHGALCVAYSGQCLTSEALGGRSANRGQCAQACRLPYEMVVDGTPRDLGDRAYLLSPQDLAAYDQVRELAEAGVVSFKIEGRLKGGPYVAATTQTYRAAIDAAADFHLTRRQELDLAQTFSRGLTPGFLAGVNHQKLVRGRFPKSRGVRIGTVRRVTKTGVRIAPAETIPDLVKPGDGVMFDLGRPETTEPGGRVAAVRRVGDELELAFPPGVVDFAAVPVGCDVWKTDDPALRKRLEATYARDEVVRRVPVVAKLTGVLGGPLTLTLTDPDGRSAAATWPGPLEVARSPVDVAGPLGRLGDTPFALADVVNELPAGVLLPKSVLNDLRRRAAADLIAARHPVHAVVDPMALDTLRASGRRKPAVECESLQQPAYAGRSPQITVLCRTPEQLAAALARRPAAVYCEFEDPRRYAAAVEAARTAGVPVGLAPLRVWKPGEDGFQTVVVRAAPDIVLVRNLAGIDFFRTELPNATLVGDFALNVANDLTAAWLVGEGLSRLVPSFDLNWDQFRAMLGHSPANWFEPVIHQHMPMFHMEHCVFAAFLSSGKDHRDCGRPCDRHKVDLKDRVGAAFPVVPDAGCRNTVFNAVPQSAAEYVGRMRSLGVTRFRIDLLRETPDEVVRLVEQYSRVINGVADGKQTWKQLKAVNQLGVTRGTLNLL